jgi:nucleotide-binding universal stress UspA family protein
MGLELAESQGASVTFLYIVPPTDWRVSRLGPSPPSPYRLELSEEDAALHEAAEKAKARGVDATLEVVAGEPADAIVGYADTAGADLVVVGSRGRGAVAGALLGSVSKAVVNRASRPVLVVRGARTPAGAVSP